VNELMREDVLQRLRRPCGEIDLGQLFRPD
jgi:hypothetical protein